MDRVKRSWIYIVFSLAIIGYYGYTAFNGIAFWESSSVIKNTDYSGNRTRGVHTFYHK